MATFTLPIEIITNILSRLPVKSLFRCTIVSKFFNHIIISLIKNPYFIKLHLNLTLTSSTNHYLVLTYLSFYSAEFTTNTTNLRENNHLTFVEHDNRPLRRKIDFVGSCHGVVCIIDYNIRDVIFLYNPLIESHRKLPSIPDLKKVSKETKTLVYGFGYDSETDDYKVIRWLQDSNFKIFYNEVQIYSLKNNSWNSVEPMPYIPYYTHKHGVLFNECLHFLVFKQELGMKHRFIAKFNLRTEKHSIFGCPNFEEKSRGDLLVGLCALKERLCFFVNYPIVIPVHPFLQLLKKELNFDIERVDCWVMKEYGKEESWSKWFSFRTADMGIGSMFRPVVCSNDGKKILFEVQALMFGWFDVEKKSFERFTTTGLPKPPITTDYFVGSLVFLGDDEKVQSKRGVNLRRKTKKNHQDKFFSAEFGRSGFFQNLRF